MFKLGLIINPYAGLGGTVGLKGSDGENIRNQAIALGAEARALARMERTLSLLTEFREQIIVYCFTGAMGEISAQAYKYNICVVGAAEHCPTEARDTMAAALALWNARVDLILFAGGDGTARLIADAVGTRQPVLGVPAGVKMHSGVYAISPEAASEIVKQLLSGVLVNIVERDVKDIDEEAVRKGKVSARLYGTLMVPEDSRYLQQVKNSAREQDELAQLDTAQEMIDQLDPNILYIVGPGSTTQLFLQQLGLIGTLLGVDLLLNGALIKLDVNAQDIINFLQNYSGYAKIIITPIGGQGHIFGRGNQQITAAILRKIGTDNIFIIATRGKMIGFNGRPLLVDTNDPELDQQMVGFRAVITGYRETIMYPVGYASITN